MRDRTCLYLQDFQLGLDEALLALTPKLRKRRYIGWVFAITFLILGGWAAFAAFTAQGDVAPRLKFLAIIVGPLGAIIVDGSVRVSAQRMIIPLLTETIGLRYQRKATRFLQALPRRLLPKGSLRHAEDWISGTIEGRRLDLAEVWIQTMHGKTPTTLFRGYVVRFQTLRCCPPFFIAPKRTTTTWFNKIIVNDLVEVEERAGKSGDVYGIWLTKDGVEKQHLALHSVLDILFDLETKVDGDAKLYSVTSTGKEMHVAMSHKKDLFRIGGLLIRESKIRKGVQRALGELQIPLQIASLLLQAERESEESNC